MSLVPVERVANRVRHLDDAFIGADGHSVTPAFIDYALPLLGMDPFPPYHRL
jgi:6-phosphofructokinase 1